MYYIVVIPKHTKELTTQITVQIKNVYGIEKIYPICEQAKIFAAMTGCKTLTAATVNYIKKLGYSVAVQQGATEL